MTGEHIPDVQPEKMSEPPLTRFPVFHLDGQYHYDTPSELFREDQIAHYEYRVHSPGRVEVLNRFGLLKTIRGLHFEFKLGQRPYEGYSLIFKTREYEFATTNLGADAYDEIGFTLAAFIESVAALPEYNMKEILVEPADSSYTIEEMRQCLEQILASPRNESTREELTERYKGSEIFDHYESLFGKQFLKQHYNSKSRASGRARLFMREAKRYLPNWSVETDFDIGGKGFRLKRKEP